jgi:uncharacterized repeat protein (TIGR01451 family)/CSLREA domain-containing protein
MKNHIKPAPRVSRLASKVNQHGQSIPPTGLIRVVWCMLILLLLSGISLFWLFSVTLAPMVQAAGGITVTTTIDEFGSGAGCSLREALQTVNTNADFGGCVRTGIPPSPPYTIYVPNGIYHITRTGFPEDLNVSGDLDIATTVTIQGAGTGNTILNGHNGTNPDRVLHIVYSASNAAVTISDMTVQNSLRTGGDSGGAVTNSGNHAILNLTNLALLNNTADRGAGVSNFNGTLNLTNVAIMSNTATDGGGIYNFSGLISATNCIILNNRAGDSGGNEGGGIYNGGGSIHIRNSTIGSNTATTCGGGIYSHATLNILNSAIIGNRAVNGGGLCNYPYGTVNIANSTISGNLADTHGGGIHNNSSLGTLNLTHVTISNNTADADGSGIGDAGGIFSSSGTANLKNTIVAGNVDWGAQNPDIGGVLNSDGYNLIGNVGSSNFASNTTGDYYGDPNGTTASNAGASELPVPINPLLGPLASSPAYHPLLGGSPAIDQIPLSNCTFRSSGSNPLFADGASVTIDLVGTPRPRGAMCDMGPHEFFQFDLALTKISTPSFVQPGQTLTYTLAFTNFGPLTAANILVTDVVPITLTNLNVASAGATITPTAGITFAWQVQDLASGQSGCITVTGIVSPALSAEKTFTNTALITTTWLDSDINSANNTDQSAVTVTLPHVTFSVPVYNVTENAALAVITVTRTPYSRGTATVNLASSDDTASSFSDYVPINQLLTFTPGMDSLTATLTFTDDTIDELDETVNLALSSPTGAILGPIPTATLTILDNDIANFTLSKFASQTSLPEPGGIITFSVNITNTGVEAINLNSLTDSIQGDLNGRGTCATGGAITAGSRYTCAFTATVSGNAGLIETNVLTATVSDDEANRATGNADATVTITDVPASILVVKTANLNQVVAGGAVTFTVQVINTSAVDGVTITSLTDNIRGSLNGQGTCVVPLTISVSRYYQCAFTVLISGEAGDRETDVVTASGTDDDRIPVAAADDETITILSAPPSLRVHLPIIFKNIGARPYATE